jgi:hypothetical protein
MIFIRFWLLLLSAGIAKTVSQPLCEIKKGYSSAVSLENIVSEIALI